MNTPEMARSAAEAPRWIPPKAEPADSPEAIQALRDIQADMKRKAETMEKETQGPLLEIVKAIGELRTETAERIAKAQAETAERIAKVEAASIKAIAEVRTATAEKIGKAEAATADRIGKAEAATAEKIAKVQTETIKAIAEVRTEAAKNKAELQTQIADSKEEMLKHSLGTRWTIGTIIGAGILLFAALSFAQSCS